MVYFDIFTGILQNATRQPPEPSQFHGGSVVVQRVINSAGQPRKVVLPMAESIGDSLNSQRQVGQLSTQQMQQQHQHQRLKSHDFSPAHSRCYGTPGRLITAPATGPSRRDSTYNP